MSPATRSRPFDLCGPLPTGVTVLEASAGTGKTYTIAALAARYVAEGTPLERLLLVTFTRMATGELRERVRERLVSVERGLLPAGSARDSGDPVVELLSRAPPAEVTLRRERLRRALANFDAATIATTHGFCQEVLGGLGIAGDLERESVFIEDIGDLLGEVLDDLYVRRFHRGERPPFGRAQAAAIARVAAANPSAPIAAAEGAIPEMRRRLALAVRVELELRKRRMAAMTYDDLLTRLDEALSGDGEQAAAARLRARFGVVLVDEFQDTDPVQWDIMRRAFGAGGATLILIGDPKQAIYAFRGADVYAYLHAARSASARATLDVNWRSDQGLIDAYDTMFGGAKLGHPGIVYRRVRAATANGLPRLSGAPHPAPLRVRVLHRDEPGLARTPAGYARNASAREHIAKDLAADLVALLSSEATIERRGQDSSILGRERVRPGHIAVLVPTNRNAALIRGALEEVGIPAVTGGAGSVFATETAREWLHLLEAIERPSWPPRARAAALTSFLGWSPERVATAGEEAWEQVHRQLHDWARVLRERGVAALTETITRGEPAGTLVPPGSPLAVRLPERILSCADGERRMTDLRHVSQLLNEVAVTEQLGAPALAAWLRRRIAEAERDTSDEERSRRLESDAEAIQVLTIHRSKGLEFPIVYLPFLWEPGYIPREAQPVFFHDPLDGDARTIDVSLEGADFRRHREQAEVEHRGEDLRLAYVALTRAQHQAVVWWAGSWDSRHSPLGRLLFSRDEEGVVAASGALTPDDGAVVARLEDLAAQAPGRIGVERSRRGMPVSWSPPLAEPAELEAAVFDRGVDELWRRTSFSDLTAGAYEAHGVGSEPEEGAGVLTDEPAGRPLAFALGAARGGDEESGDMAAGSLLAEMGVGVHVGTLVHRVLEATDFAAPDLSAELTAQLAAAHARGRVEIGDPERVAAGLRAAIETPLGPLLGGARLRDVRRPDRLNELAFELPLAGGDDRAGGVRWPTDRVPTPTPTPTPTVTPTVTVTLAAIGAVLREHLPPGDPLAGYAERLGDPALRPAVRGYLTGSIDMVVRMAGRDVLAGAGAGADASAGASFAIVDYKTNWLAPPGEALTVGHHRPSILAAEMQRAHYGLQALLYTCALHRYLRWRVPGYDASTSIAGVLYLFLRGMHGTDTPTVGGTPCGVFAWRPPGALVEALSDALDAPLGASPSSERRPA